VIALANSNNDTVNAIKAAKDYGITPKQYIAPLVLYLSTGNTSVIWRATHSAVGFHVTLIQTKSLRSSRTTTNA
jgi:hypothetical protein